jgi:hypothetical protein
VIINLVLWIVGVTLILGGILAIRAPAARFRELRETEANLRRYDSWRGGRRGSMDQGVTGADVMLDQMRQRVRLLSVVIVAGIALVVVGFLLR